MIYMTRIEKLVQCSILCGVLHLLCVTHSLVFDRCNSILVSFGAGMKRKTNPTGVLYILNIGTPWKSILLVLSLQMNSTLAETLFFLLCVYLFLRNQDYLKAMN